MTSKLSRRGFLVSLIALGATYFLPEDATAEQVDQIWEEALKTPWYFEVNEWGTITEPDAGVAQRWGDVFEDIWPDDMETYRDVISTVDACVPLQSHFTVLASDEADRLAEIPPRQLGPKGRKLLASLEEDAFDGWRVWVKSEGDAGVARFRAAIEDWLQQPADAAQIAWFPVGYGAQGQAMAFFERMDWDERNALGVVIIEGDHPGSTYYAAELKVSIADANETAEALKLPFRFRPEGSA
jgi:hypothetical protein